MTKRLLLALPVLICVFASSTLAATVRVKADKTPLRAGASASAAVLDQLKAGAVLDLVDVDREWYKVRDPLTKKEGFVAASAVELDPGPSPAGAQKPGAAKPPAKPAPAPARPPKKGEWTDRGYFWANAVYQGGSTSFRQTQTWTYFAEPATTSAVFPAKNVPGFDVAGGYRVWRNLAVGAAVSMVSRSTTTTVTGSIPSPIYANRPTTLTGGFGSTNSETALHVQATWAVPMPPKMVLMVFAGPSVFSIKQTIVQPQGIGISSGYPYEAGTITSAATTDASKSAIGFGAGADFGYYFSKTVGVGGMVRFARATATFPVTGMQSVSVDAGGFQIGVGLRVRFPASKAVKPAVPAKPQPKPVTPPKKK